MLLVLIGWLAVLVGTVPIGAVLLRAAGPRLPEGGDGTPLVHPLLAGLAAASVWGMCWSLFAGLGTWAFTVWMFLSATALVRERRHLSAIARQRLAAIAQEHRAAWFVRLALITVALLGSSAPSELVDEGGYILPYLRWLETYGAVPGIAQLEDRFGFNSIVHSSGALFSLHWAYPDGLYDLNGLLLVAVGSWFASGVSRLIRERRLQLSDLLCAFFLLFLLRNMLTGPRSDLPAMLLSEVMLVMLARRIEEDAVLADDRSFRILVLYGALLPAVKLSSALLSLIPAGIAVGMMLRRMRLPWAWIIAAGSIILVPWTVMNVRVSGYVVYPLHQLDLVDVDWKLPKAIVRQQYYYVSEFARTNAQAWESEKLHHERGLRTWVPIWFARENVMNRATALTLLAAVLALAGLMVLKGRTLWRGQRALVLLGALLVYTDASWFLHAPAFRFGWAPVMATIVLALHVFLGRWREGAPLRFLALALLAAFTAQNVWKSVPRPLTALAARLVLPVGPPDAPFRSVDLHGVTVHEAEGYYCWGTPPPCLHHGFDRRITPRGTRVEDGFRWDPQAR